MQRITNCVIHDNGKILMLQKPSRLWWVAPGGKMEPGESVQSSAIREIKEETNIIVKNPNIRGIYTMVIKDEGKTISEWMLFAFEASEWEGTAWEYSPEGLLKWIDKDSVSGLDMNPGDYHILQHTLFGKGVMYGTFYFTPDNELLSYQLNGGELNESGNKRG